MAAARCKIQNLQAKKAVAVEVISFYKTSRKSFLHFCHQIRQNKLFPDGFKVNNFLYTSTRGWWWRWRWWRRWRRRRWPVGLSSAQFCEPHQWWRCHFLVFLLSASSADRPLGWFKLPSHFLCCWRLLCCCWLLHRSSDRLSCHGNAWRHCYTSGNPGNLSWFAIVVSVLFCEELT